MPSSKRFTVSFKVRQNGKTYKLKTTCKYKAYKPFKRMLLNGKDITGRFVNGIMIIGMKGLKGKKFSSLKASFKINKGFVSSGIRVYQGKIKLKKTVRLKGGNMIVFDFAKRGWKERKSFGIFVL